MVSLSVYPRLSFYHFDIPITRGYGNHSVMVTLAIYPRLF